MDFKVYKREIQWRKVSSQPKSTMEKVNLSKSFPRESVLCETRFKTLTQADKGECESQEAKTSSFQELSTIIHRNNFERFVEEKKVSRIDNTFIT